MGALCTTGNTAEQAAAAKASRPTDMVEYEAEDEDTTKDTIISKGKKPPPKTSIRRQAVSAAPFSPSQMKKRVVIPKSDEDREIIRARLLKCFLFAELDKVWWWW